MYLFVCWILLWVLFLYIGGLHNFEDFYRGKNSIFMILLCVNLLMLSAIWNLLSMRIRSWF